ncbi:glucosamine-6-phosphate deaminase [Gemmatimonadetes bacterium T265]|nr:glucosamine-6-phosphate deaminase [Gemmatimonadetes bacterium T265]
MASATPLRVLASPEAIGEELAGRVLAGAERARLTGRRFLLGCPTGRTPRPVYAAVARRLAAAPQPLAHVVLVMMDEYLVPDAGGALAYAPADRPWSCHHFARAEMVGPWNAALPEADRLPDASVWFPDPRDPAAYDARIADAGGIDLFLLASGASDGHVAFNPPGSPRESRTRVIPLSDETRRDNLQTFPTFGALDAVPHHGVSVGIATIAAAREGVMVVWGAGKRLTLARMLGAGRYEPDWPATVVHACAAREILSDADAAAWSGAV